MYQVVVCLVCTGTRLVYASCNGSVAPTDGLQLFMLLAHKLSNDVHVKHVYAYIACKYVINRQIYLLSLRTCTK